MNLDYTGRIGDGRYGFLQKEKETFCCYYCSESMKILLVPKSQTAELWKIDGKCIEYVWSLV